jgi:DNA-binding transcriptional ArsR family regulator
MNITETTQQIEAVYDAQASLFRVLDHPARLAILQILRGGEHCVCHVEAALGMRQAYISQHLMILREAGLVEDRREGRMVFYRAIRPEIYRVIDAMSRLTGKLVDLTSAADCPCPKCKE